MRLVSLQLADYRNYRNLSCGFSPGITMVTGDNAQGKTNLVEAIHYLSIGRAYRQARDEQLVRWGAKAFRIKAETESRQGGADIEIEYRNDERPPKTILLDGLRRTKWEDMSGALMSVLFSPESMSIIKGQPQERRNFLDHDIAQISMAYSVDLYKYRRLLAQRNALLKRLGLASAPLAAKKEQLAVWDEQLFVCGSRIVEKRLAFLGKMMPMTRLLHRKLTAGKENIELRYIHYGQKYASPGKTPATGAAAGEILGFLQDVRENALMDDLRNGLTQWGPHRDEVSILLDGADMRQYGSQGQQRTGVLALKLAELEIFRGESGEYPILLLDDVLSELDESRQRQLLSVVNEKSIQCLITATVDGGGVFAEKRERKHYRVIQGEIREV